MKMFVARFRVYLVSKNVKVFFFSQTFLCNQVSYADVWFFFFQFLSETYFRKRDFLSLKLIWWTWNNATDRTDSMERIGRKWNVLLFNVAFEQIKIYPIRQFWQGRKFDFDLTIVDRSEMSLKKNYKFRWKWDDNLGPSFIALELNLGFLEFSIANWNFQIPCCCGVVLQRMQVTNTSRNVFMYIHIYIVGLLTWTSVACSFLGLTQSCIFMRYCEHVCTLLATRDYPFSKTIKKLKINVGKRIKQKRDIFLSESSHAFLSAHITA